jgi:hypothetical protein
MQPNQVSRGGLLRLKGWVSGVVVFILWAATAVLGFVEILFLRTIALSIYAHFGNRVNIGILIGDVVAIIAALLWIALAIGGAEYHYKKVGQPGSWTLIGWTVAIELLILILYFVV